MIAAALHPDVVVARSRIYSTTCTLVRSGQEAFCIDSPILPDELELLPALAQQADFRVLGSLATHADWDHLLARYAFPDAPLGLAETSVERLRNEPGALQRELRDFDDEHYVQRPAPLALDSPQLLPVPGHCGIGECELELHPADGHAIDGMAIWVPWASVLICGDYLSPVEIPIVASTAAYLTTLARLEPLVDQADYVVPGHGEPIDGERALAILRDDRTYVEDLAQSGAAAKLPLARRNATQRRLHAANVARVAM